MRDKLYGGWLDLRGKLEHKKPVFLAAPDTATPMLAGNGDRWALLLAMKVTADTTVEDSAGFAAQQGASALCHTVLSEGLPTILLTYSMVGDLIFAPVFYALAPAGVGVWATEVIWRPEGFCRVDESAGSGPPEE